MKDKQLKELLEQHVKLIDLGMDLVASIEKYGMYSKYGKSPHMKEAVRKWAAYVEKTTVKIK